MEIFNSLETSRFSSHQILFGSNEAHTLQLWLIFAFARAFFKAHKLSQRYQCVEV